MVTRVVDLSPVRPVVEENQTMAQEFRTWTQSITNQSVIIGTGSPEGVIEAVQGSSYMDDAGIAGAVLYIKRDNDIGGDRTQGWILT